MARKKNGAAALEDTRDLLADTNSQIDEQRRRRGDELSGTADEAALDTFDAEIKRLEVLAGRHRERITLLEAAAAEAENERRVKEKEHLILRIEKKAHDERQAAALEISEGIAKADAGLRKLIDIAGEVQAAWPWKAHELPPCLLSPPAILTAITHELYRLGARPRLFGGQDKPGAGIHFPGGRPTRLELAGLPDRIPKLVDVMAEASDLMSRIMRGKAAAPAEEQPPPTPAAGPRSAAEIQKEVQAEADARDAMLAANTGATASKQITGAPVEQRGRTAAEIELSALLNKQNALSQDISPEGEAKYLAVCNEIARVSQQVEMEKAS